jgi:uncharacterized protein
VPSPPAIALLSFLAISALGLASFCIYLFVKYAPIIGRIFEEKPMFCPLRTEPEPGGEDVRFRTQDGLELHGTYYPAFTDHRAGVIVFCHEFLGDRWSFQPYTEGLRDLGFDLFTFDFRNHGTSDAEGTYHPLQWVSDREVVDLRAALAYLKTRTDRDPAGIGLVGISRGGGAALCVAAHEPAVWAVVTDGAFPTRGTMMAYIKRWAEIYITSQTLMKLLPDWMYDLLGWSALLRSQRKLNRRFPSVQRAAKRLAPRPWLMVHGARDAYIPPGIAEALFAHAGDPKEKWIVPDAKHNRCRELEPEAYRSRLAAFFGRHAPRRLAKGAAPERREAAAPSSTRIAASPAAG